MKAIALISGGLDSCLAAKLTQQQGIEVIGLNFRTLFCHKDDKAGFVRQAACALGIDIKTIDINEEFLQVVKQPKHGYGANMNPCIDCRILGFEKARQYLQDSGASFIVTGEVLGQRPMSQYKRALKIIERESGLDGLVLRPLSAKLLPVSIPEINRWVEREKMMSFNGRSRKPQIELAKEFGIKNYPTPAGGCLLTDREFAKRIRDLIINNEFNLRNARLLKLGRHFRISRSAKLIVGRDKQENQRLADSAEKGDFIYRPLNILGPLGLGIGAFNQALIRLSAQIICRYCDLNGIKNADIIYKRGLRGEETILNASALTEKEILALRL